MKYCIIQSVDYNLACVIKDVEVDVNKKIAEGWVPHGNLAISSCGHANRGVIVAQPMIKPDDSD